MQESGLTAVIPFKHTAAVWASTLFPVLSFLSLGKGGTRPLLRLLCSVEGVAAGRQALSLSSHGLAGSRGRAVFADNYDSLVYWYGKMYSISQVLVLRKTRMKFLANPINPQPQNQFPRIKRQLMTLSWVRLKTGGEGDDRGWDGWMASPTQWTWVWVNSESWWWTGRPAMLQSMGPQGVRHHWATNWTDRTWLRKGTSAPSSRSRRQHE